MKTSILFLALSAAIVAMPTSGAMAQAGKKGIPESIRPNVEMCMQFGYKQGCCISSYSKVSAGSMDNSVRHQQIAKCSGVAPRG